MEFTQVICEECSNCAPIFECIECEQKLCASCDEQIHRGGKRRTHIRVGLCHECRGISTQYCYTCFQNLCNQCLRRHSDHNLQRICSKTSVAIYWDLNCSRVTTSDEILQTLQNLEKLYESIDSIKAYGDSYYKFKNILDKRTVELLAHPEGLRETEAMLIEISLLNKDRTSQVLVISSKAAGLKMHLMQIQSGLPQIKILVSLNYPGITPTPVADLQNESRNYLAPPKSTIVRPLSNDQTISEKNQIEQFPVYQNFVRKKGQTYAHDHLLTYLKEFADSGVIMHDAGWLCKSFAQKSRISIEQASLIIRELEKLGHLHPTERTFCDLKTMFFTSLKLDSLSLECLLWTLRSLKIDEMLPTERAVQSRMKEVFDFKVSPSEWANILEVCRGTCKHHHTKSAPEQVRTNYSLFSSSQSLYSNSNPVIMVKEMLDPVTGLKVHVLYPKDEEWDSKDQHIKEGDSLGVKQTPDWEAFVDFLSDYFAACRPGDDSRAIPGGRYGCAQFLKLCGNQRLRDCSLGKLSYMVQLSIDEDLLRYHRTLLIWVPLSGKAISDTENAAKLAAIQQAIGEILRECKEGMSLAQLPLYIKRKLSFPLDLAELGFAKLKDLLLIMPEVEIELRGTNHPFAILKNQRKRNKEEDIKTCINQLLNENSRGLPGPKLEMLINSKQGYCVNWMDFKCANIYEFILKRTVGMFDVAGSENSRIIVKGKSKFSGSLKPQGIENYSQNEHMKKDIIIIGGEHKEPSSDEESPDYSVEISSLQRTLMNNPFAVDEFFNPFQYRKPPGFN